MTELGESTHIENFREIIGLIKWGLIALLAISWVPKMIMGDISMKIEIILTIAGIIRKAK